MLAERSARAIFKLMTGPSFKESMSRQLRVEIRVEGQHLRLEFWGEGGGGKKGRAKKGGGGKKSLRQSAEDVL
jgi:hypothetical protein